ncbi:hypothetical protein E1265_22445, partial [Streptomyces sp. 8K308]
MAESLEELEDQMAEYRTAISVAKRRGDQAGATQLRAELREIVKKYDRRLELDEMEELKGAEAPAPRGGNVEPPQP